MARTKFPVSQQRLQALRVTKLKNLVNVDIEFDERGLTAIMGPNGFGKSTVLHALATCFKPQYEGQGEEFKYVDFFPNTPHGVWSGSEYHVAHRFRLGPDGDNRESIRIYKSAAQWYPIAKYRPERELFFIGVKSAVPKIETQGTRKKVVYSTHVLDDESSNELRGQAGYIFNRDYTRYHSNVVSRNRKFIGVEYRGINYSSLAMGAGEQRVFEILSIVLKARNYALILIDEIDLLLHSDALARMMEVLNDYTEQKNLQIVFTTHRESILDFEDFVAIRHLYQGPVPPHRTFCFKETKPDAITRLTGRPHRTLAVACEDNVAFAIIEKVATQAGVRKYTEITKFGAADNCFTLIAALMLNNENLIDSIFVVDGDRYETDDLKAERMKKVLTGDHPADVEHRTNALSHVRQFVPGTVIPPERKLYELIRRLPAVEDPEVNDVISASQSIEAVVDDHEFVREIIEILGSSFEVGLTRIVNVAATAEGWDDYVAPVREWFNSKHDQVVEAIAL